VKSELRNKFYTLMLKLYNKWSNREKRAFLELLEYNPRAKVLDLGCGNGKFTLEIKRKIGTRLVYGVDIHEPSLRKASKHGIIVVKHDLNVFPYPFNSNEFDVIVSRQVIEHLYYPVKFLKEIHRMLKPGGYVVISTENLASWDNIIALLLGYTPFSMEFDEGLVKVGNPLSPHEKRLRDNYQHPHVRILTYRGLIELMKFVGFKVEKVVGSGHIFITRLFEEIDRRHCRFITIKARKEQ